MTDHLPFIKAALAITSNEWITIETASVAWCVAEIERLRGSVKAADDTKYDFKGLPSMFDGMSPYQRGYWQRMREMVHEYSVMLAAYDAAKEKPNG